MLSFIGRDDTGDAKFFAYDDEASKMIQKDCDTLVNPLAPRDVLPRPLENIINKKFVLSVNLTDDSCKGNSCKQYQVKAVLQRPPRHSTAQSLIGTEKHSDIVYQGTEILQDQDQPLQIESITDNVNKS